MTASTIIQAVNDLGSIQPLQIEIKIKVLPIMKGAKVAVKIGNTLHVSAEMLKSGFIEFVDLGADTDMKVDIMPPINFQTDYIKTNHERIQGLW